ncbi:MAG TPA: DUF1918 domain-containing protein [Acidimicrobiia bacterium]|jgi:hypothetical protein
MHAKVGDHLVIKGHHVGDIEKDGEIIEVHGAGGEPPFLVRWADEERESLVFPGSDAIVEHLKKSPPKKKTA